MKPWVLASASPRRRELLALLGHPFDVEPTDPDEAPLPGESAAELVVRLARAKAGLVAVRRTDAVVIGADTVVVLDGEILGKPRDPRHATGMLRALAGRSHVVSSGVAVTVGGRTVSDVAHTTVEFTGITAAEIDAYVATGEPSDKAGAYAIQGAGGRFVERIEGSYHNVVGLPLASLVRLLRSVGESI